MVKKSRLALLIVFTLIITAVYCLAEGNIASRKTEDYAGMKLSLDSRITLNSGYEMPVIGLGTWALSDDVAEACTYAAILDGCRLFDTARYYGTEAGIGRAVRRAISEGLVTRGEIFVTTKIVPSGNADYAALIDECNARIGLDYIDLMLIHQSGTGEKQLYRAMEDRKSVV